MSQPYVGEIRAVGFNFPPVGWALCDGQTLSIAQSEVLFVLIGTTYGGDGQQTFKLPNLLGRTPIHMGNGFVQGQLSGSEEVTLLSNQLPPHSHQFQVKSSPGELSSPSGAFLASTGLGLGNTYDSSAISTEAMGISTSPSGGGQPHNNMQPYSVINYIISLFGVFPSQG